MRNAADENQVKKASEKDRFSREQELLDIKNILSTPNGRRFIWRYLGLAGVFRLSFTGNSETFFNEGQRNIGLKILDDVMESSPESYVLMSEEARGKEIKEQI